MQNKGSFILAICISQETEIPNTMNMFTIDICLEHFNAHSEFMHRYYKHIKEKEIVVMPASSFRKLSNILHSQPG